MTRKGILTSDGTEYEVDTIVFAIGYDAMVGAIKNIDITGLGGVKLAEKWALGPQTYLGVSTSGFPNLFTVHGPGSPSVRYNMVPGAEFHVNFMLGALKLMQSKGLTQIVTERSAEEDWTKKVAQ